MKSPYSTRLISRSTSFLVPLGVLLILFGIASIVLSAISLDKHRVRYIGRPTNITAVNGNPIAYSEQSIWPTLGKGIWTGLFFVALGILSIIAHREKTLAAVRIVSVLAFIGIFLSLYLFLSSIIVFQRYVVEGRLSANQRTAAEQKEVVLNVLLLVFGVLAFLVSSILTIASLIVGNFCQRKTDDDDDNVEPFSQRPPPPAYPGPPYYG